MDDLRRLVRSVGGGEGLNVVRERRFAGEAGGVMHTSTSLVPPWLSRPWRRVRKRIDGFINTSRPMRGGTGSVLAVSFFAIGLAYGCGVSGAWRPIASATAASVGLEIGDVAIDGGIETSAQDVWGALQLEGRGSLVGYDLAAARARVLELPWVRTAVLRVTFPGRLDVQVAEREPFAVWSIGERLTIFERSGEPITDYSISDIITERFSDLPRVTGEGAAEHAAEILPVAARHPMLARRIASFARVADRRWDVVFDNGARANLPTDGLGEALMRFERLEREHAVLARPITAIDLRLPDRVALRLTEEAATEHSEMAQGALKSMKAAEKTARKKRL